MLYKFAFVGVVGSMRVEQDAVLIRPGSTLISRSSEGSSHSDATWSPNSRREYGYYRRIRCC